MAGIWIKVGFRGRWSKMRVVKKVVKGISSLDNEFTPTNMTHFIIGQPFVLP